VCPDDLLDEVKSFAEQDEDGDDGEDYEDRKRSKLTALYFCTYGAGMTSIMGQHMCMEHQNRWDVHALVTILEKHNEQVFSPQLNKYNQKLNEHSIKQLRNDNAHQNFVTPDEVKNGLRFLQWIMQELRCEPGRIEYMKSIVDMKYCAISDYQKKLSMIYKVR